MRQYNKQVLSASDNANTNGTQIDANQLVSVSFHFFFGDATASGECKVQGSNDITPLGNMAQPSNFTVTNWVDIPSACADITAGTSAMILIPQSCFRWLRAAFTVDTAGVQTISPVADVAGSLNNKYFFLNSQGNTHRYYVWINVNGAGTDPMIAGRTGIEVDVATGATAAAVGTALAAAIAAAGGGNDFTATGTTTVTVTNKVVGPYTAATDAGATGFTFAITAGGTSTVTVNMNALSI